MISDIIAIFNNFSKNDWIELIASTPILIAFLLSLMQYKKLKHNYLIILMGSWFFFWVAHLLMPISEAALSIDLHIICNIVFVIGGILAIIFVEMTAHDKVNHHRVIIVIVFSLVYILFAFEPDSLIIAPRGDGNIGVISNGIYRTLGSFLMILIFSQMSYFSFKIYKHSLKEERKYALLNLIGGLTTFLGTTILYLLGYSVKVPGSTNFVFSIGFLFISIAFLKAPQLAFVLPFKVQVLYIINFQSGLPIARKEWAHSDNNSKLIPVAISAIAGISNIMLKAGKIKEIQLKDSLLILNYHKSKQFIVSLITSNSVQILREAIEKFSEDFYDNYKDVIEEYTIEVSKFKNLDNLVKKHFYFLPHPDIKQNEYLESSGSS